MIPSASPFKCCKGKQKVLKWLKSERSSSAPSCRPAQTELFLLFQGNLSENGLCRFSPDACFFVLGAKKKEKKKSWNFHREPAELGRTISKCSRTFWFAFCVDHSVYSCMLQPGLFWLFFRQRRNWTGWAAVPDPPSPTTPKKRKNLGAAQPVECTLNKCRRVKVKKEGNVTDVTCRTTSVPGGKVPSTYALMEGGGRSKLCFPRHEKESGCFANVMASLACWRHHFYFLPRIQKLSRYRWYFRWTDSIFRHKDLTETLREELEQCQWIYIYSFSNMEKKEKWHRISSYFVSDLISAFFPLTHTHVHTHSFAHTKSRKHS